MMMVSVDSWTGVLSALRLRWRRRLLLLRVGNVRRWNARQMGQMRRRRRNLMRGRRWRRRMTHVGMGLLLLLLLGWLRGMAVNHPAPAKPSRSFRNQFVFCVWDRLAFVSHESLLRGPVFVFFFLSGFFVNHFSLFSVCTTVIWFHKLITFCDLAFLEKMHFSRPTQ